MNKPELNRLRSFLEGEIEQRKRLGGYNQDALAILNLFEIVAKIVDHLDGVETRIRKAAKKNDRTRPA